MASNMEAMDPDPPDPPDISPGSKRRGDDSIVLTAKKSANSSTTTDSSQIVYIHPSLVIGVRQYTPIDKGPFLVHVSRSEPDPDAGTSIRPIKFGQLLFKNKVPNICPEGVKKVGRNKISIEFKTYVDANKFLDNPILSSNKYEAVIPTFNISKMGLVRQVPVDISMDEFAQCLSFPNGCGTVLKARRLNRKSIVEGKPIWIPTQTVVVTFQGQVLPKRVFLYHNSLPVETYQFPTIQCLNCCRFGHVKAQCRSTPRCYRCTQPHSGESCKTEESDASCLHCSGRHFANSKDCPELGRQKAIKLLMSQENKSYDEASQQYPKTVRPYSEVTQSSIFTPPQILASSQRRQLPLTPSVSYKKNLSSIPRVRPPLSKSFDRATHQSIVSDGPSQLPNGYALSQSSNSLTSSQDDSLLESLLSMLINIITRNNSHLPSHVAHKLSQIISISNNGSSSSSVEHQKPSSQET